MYYILKQRSSHVLYIQLDRSFFYIAKEMYFRANFQTVMKRILTNQFSYHMQFLARWVPFLALNWTVLRVKFDVDLEYGLF